MASSRVIQTVRKTRNLYHSDAYRDEYGAFMSISDNALLHVSIPCNNSTQYGILVYFQAISLEFLQLRNRLTADTRNIGRVSLLAK
jgi:hypothetical protein